MYGNAVSIFLLSFKITKEKNVSPSDLEMGFNLAVRLIDAGIFEEIDNERLKEISPRGSALVACGDRDRFSHYFNTLREAIDVHPITLNGGSILLGTDIDHERKRIVTEDISDALGLKSMDTVVLSSHFPCGKAGLLGFGLKEILIKTLEGKEHLKRFFPNVRIVPLISIDWRPSSLDRKDATFIETFAFHLHHKETIRSFE